MPVGIVSDTHDNVDAVEAIVETFRSEGVETVVHCGDYVAPLIVPRFEPFELHGVLGNNDGDVAALHDRFEELGNDSTLHGKFAAIELQGQSFAINHGEDLELVEALAASGKYDYVCYGHYHTTDHRDHGETTVINPGAHFPPTAEEDRTVAIVHPESDEVSFHQI